MFLMRLTFGYLVELASYKLLLATANAFRRSVSMVCLGPAVYWHDKAAVFLEDNEWGLQQSGFLAANLTAKAYERNHCFPKRKPWY